MNSWLAMSFLIVLLLIVSSSCQKGPEMREVPKSEPCMITELNDGIHVQCAESDRFFPHPKREVQMVEVPVEVIIEEYIEVPVEVECETLEEDKHNHGKKYGWGKYKSRKTR